MTPEQEELEQQLLADAIRRWFGAGGHYDRVIAIAEQLYATRAASQPTEKQ
jgi:hypothetical protein